MEAHIYIYILHTDSQICVPILDSSSPSSNIIYTSCAAKLSVCIGNEDRRYLATTGLKTPLHSGFGPQLLEPASSGTPSLI